eukprot:6951596-Pyramimonas_sp.AAC.2
MPAAVATTAATRSTGHTLMASSCPMPASHAVTQSQAHSSFSVAAGIILLRYIRVLLCANNGKDALDTPDVDAGIFQCHCRDVSESLQGCFRVAIGMFQCHCRDVSESLQGCFSVTVG